MKKDQEVIELVAIENKKAVDPFWCTCEDEDDYDAIYVENFKGVKHGYICPCCKKFVQVG